jgi:hypothetical protein
MASGVYYWWGVLHAAPHLGGDFELNWIAARAVMAGHNPVEAAAAAGWPWPLYYPLPAQLVSIPFAWLPFVPAECLFVGTSAGILAFAITGRAWWGLLIFLTPSFLHAYYHAQWSPLLTGAMMLPILGGLLAAKPSTGLAYFFSRPSWKGAAGVAALVILSFIVRASWLGEWRGAIAGADAIVAPITRPGGFLLLMALPFWRRAEARLLIGLALVPHRTLLYETLPLFTIPRTFRQMAVLVICAALAAVSLLLSPDSGPRETAQLADSWPVLLVCLYLPALFMMLWTARVDASVPGSIARERG